MMGREGRERLRCKRESQATGGNGVERVKKSAEKPEETEG